MPETTAKIRAKGLDATGVTEEIASQLFTQVGRHYMAIIEFKVEEPHGPNGEGRRRVDLVLTQVEPAIDENLAEHLRELNRTLYYNRGLDGHTGSTTDGQEPTVDQVLAAGAKHRPHPFLPVDASEDDPICDVCGGLEAAGVHSVQEVLDQPNDRENPDEPALDVAGDLDDAYNPGDAGDDEPWEYEAPEGATADPFKAPA